METGEEPYYFLPCGIGKVANGMKLDGKTSPGGTMFRPSVLGWWWKELEGEPSTPCLLYPVLFWPLEWPLGFVKLRGPSPSPEGATGGDVCCWATTVLGAVGESNWKPGQDWSGDMSC